MRYESILVDQDYEAIEFARGTLTPEDVTALVEWYDARTAWPEKVAAATLLRDVTDPTIERVMLDVLRAPGAGDIVDLCKAAALGILDEAHDRFGRYYNDRKLLHRTVLEVLAMHDLEPAGPFEAPESGRPLGGPEEPALLRAVMNREVETALDLLRHGADPDQRRTVGGQSALWWAALLDLDEVVAELVARGALLEATDQYGSTPLVNAAASGAWNASRRLVEAGANVMHVSPRGKTVLMAAIRGGHPTVVTLLLERGASVVGHQPDFTPLALACFEGALEIAEALLERRADPNVAVDGGPWSSKTPLMLAAQAGRPRMVQTLLRSGADPTATDRQGRTARQLAGGRRAEAVRASLGA